MKAPEIIASRGWRTAEISLVVIATLATIAVAKWAQAFLIPLIIWRVIRRTRRMLRNAVETYQLTIDDVQIMRTQNGCPTVVILRSEVQKISERSGQGFHIETAKRAANICESLKSRCRNQRGRFPCLQEPAATILTK